MNVLKNMRALVIASALSSSILLIDTGECADQTIKAAEDQAVKSREEKKAEAIKNVNNIVCPVSDDEIDPATAVKYEYRDKIFNFCCDACIKHFMKHPDRFAHKVAIMNEWK